MYTQQVLAGPVVIAIVTAKLYTQQVLGGPVVIAIVTPKLYTHKTSSNQRLNKFLYLFYHCCLFNLIIKLIEGLSLT